MATAYRIKRAHRAAVLNRQRRAAAIIVMISLFAAWFLNGTFFSPTSTEAAEENYIYVSVCSGDTLWSIAGEYCSGGDLRDFVRRIALLNDVEDYIICEGDVLKIPG